MKLRRSTTTLFIACGVYILFFILSALVPSPYFAAGLEIVAVLAAVAVTRMTLFCRATPADTDLGFSPKKLPATLPYLPLFVGAVMGLSYLSGLVTDAIGISSDADYGDSFPVCLICSVLVPAVVEEIVCRYLFLRYLLPHSRVGAVVASAIFFAFLHGSFTQFPYALFAGLFLGALAAYTGSVIPGMVFHFTNNLFCAILIFWGGGTLEVVLLVCLAALAVLSLFYLLFNAKRLLSRLRSDEEKTECSWWRVAGSIFVSPLVLFILLFVWEACVRVWGY